MRVSRILSLSRFLRGALPRVRIVKRNVPSRKRDVTMCSTATIPRFSPVSVDRVADTFVCPRFQFLPAMEVPPQIPRGESDLRWFYVFLFFFFFSLHNISGELMRPVLFCTFHNRRERSALLNKRNVVAVIHLRRSENIRRRCLAA